MPRRDDLHKLLILGSGPIVIGQAAEFDYSGVQACKVLREEGYEIVLVNSNPATIMTDPELADATYVEPLLAGPVRQRDRTRAAGRAARHARRPDRAEPRHGAARRRHARAPLRRADRRQLRRDRLRRGPRTLPRRDGGRRAEDARLGDRHHRGRGARARAGARAAVHRAARLHARRPRRGHRARPRRARRDRRPGARSLPDRAGAARPVRARVGGVRARGHARLRRQRRRRVLDRERRPDGRAHRRLRDRCAPADAPRPPLPGAARPGARGDPCRRRRDRRLERAVRRQPGHARRSS